LGIFETYTWSHGIDNSEFRYFAPGVASQTRGSDIQDIRQRFTTAVNYDLPFGNAKGFTGALAKQWQVNMIAVVETGLPLTIINNTPLSNTGGSDRPNVLASPVLPVGQRTLTEWFNTSVFKSQAIDTFGNAGRSILSGPGKINFDISIHREFTLNERMRLQFRAEGFNVTNTPALGAPNVNFGSPGFGSITSAGPPRIIQLALKLLF
jgi:hypothetical protein